MGNDEPVSQVLSGGSAIGGGRGGAPHRITVRKIGGRCGLKPIWCGWVGVGNGTGRVRHGAVLRFSVRRFVPARLGGGKGFGRGKRRVIGLSGARGFGDDVSGCCVLLAR